MLLRIRLVPKWGQAIDVNATRESVAIKGMTNARWENGFLITFLRKIGGATAEIR